jgi:hypothetical protein
VEAVPIVFVVQLLVVLSLVLLFTICEGLGGFSFYGHKINITLIICDKYAELYLYIIFVGIPTARMWSCRKNIRKGGEKKTRK